MTEITNHFVGVAEVDPLVSDEALAWAVRGFERVVSLGKWWRELRQLEGLDYLLDPKRRSLDRALCVAVAPVIGAMVAAGAGAIYLDDGGPATIKIPRVGQNQAVFDMLKLRTMKRDHERMSEALGDQRFAITARDERLTRMGRVLRMGFDEAPQLLNIWRGNMSVVGLRPIHPIEIEIWRRASTLPLGEFDDWMDFRHVPLGGVIGPDGIRGHQGMPFSAETFGERRNLDRNFIETASFSSDIDILGTALDAVWERRKLHFGRSAELAPSIV